ncbi:SO_0444 family Cu/Zn efflux transporter [Thalassomonas viridans]|uniref:SO_0444 family Cu/Zn efflux transporter n=1 Tax=Thalassomonas viridans TaxID=137584 RepID=A0AAE9Z4A2_9GAMM|nr:SO_0444 family Cu/Zn efflux transporter [Thalassomonas viridans]WDE06501.1 SO_0444 family Cu/Zn efflux transporter [Thalassomonas viridans]
MEQLTALLNNFIDLSAEASPWLLLGLLIAGLMKAWLPKQILNKHLGKGKSGIVKAALVGAPLPLCSCGVIPVATELKRGGASDPATASFLVATPETGVDSVSVSYAILGPVFAVYRPVTAIASAIITGLLVSTDNSAKKALPTKNSPQAEPATATACCAPSAPQAVTSSCCATSTPATKEKAATGQCGTSSAREATATGSCCPDTAPKEASATNCCASGSTQTENKETFSAKTLQGIKYAATQLVDDIIVWLFIGLVFATLVRTFLPPSLLTSYGSGLHAMLIMIAISIPMYICATASTPIAAGFILAGISPGTALVFMMAGPATNISTLGVIKNEMGSGVLIRYLGGIGLCALAFGYLLDWGLLKFNIDINQQMQHSHEVLPYWFSLGCAILLALLAIKPLRNKLL